jgi:hypothetical protein
MKVEMTGMEDRQGPWKTAICGFAGVGKTLMASTAANPLFVFFQENPRLKSIADRAIPHVKLTNDYVDGGASVQDKLHALSIRLQLSDIEQAATYQTLVIDTGDELFQAMKAARTFQNGGEFAVGDWSWIGDAYREVMLGLIDLPMDVIVLYHIKSAMDEDSSYRELMLQGQAKDEAPGWFDIVGVLDTFEVVLDDGSTVTKRALLTHSSRTYSWVKDHSGALPRRFELSDGIIDDYPRMMTLVKAVPEIVVAREELETIVVPEEEAVKGNQPVPTPEELHAKKDEQTPEEKPAETQEPVQQEPPSEPEAPSEPLIEAKAESVIEEAPIPSQDTVNSPEADEGVTPGGGQDDAPDSQEQGELAEDVASPSDLEAAAALVVEELGGEEVEEIFKCDVCADQVDDKDLRDLTQIRFRKYLCREHFRDALNKAKGD